MMRGLMRFGCFCLGDDEEEGKRGGREGGLGLGTGKDTWWGGGEKWVPG